MVDESKIVEQIENLVRRGNEAQKAINNLIDAVRANNVEGGHWLVWSIEHDRWWKPGAYGYTDNIKEAGLYTFEQALDICRKANFAPDIIQEIPVPAPDKTHWAYRVSLTTHSET